MSFAGLHSILFKTTVVDFEWLDSRRVDFVHVDAFTTLLASIIHLSTKKPQWIILNGQAVGGLKKKTKKGLKNKMELNVIICT